MFFPLNVSTSFDFRLSSDPVFVWKSLQLSLAVSSNLSESFSILILHSGTFSRYPQAPFPFDILHPVGISSGSLFKISQAFTLLKTNCDENGVRGARQIAPLITFLQFWNLRKKCGTKFDKFEGNHAKSPHDDSTLQKQDKANPSQTFQHLEIFIFILNVFSGGSKGEMKQDHKLDIFFTFTKRDDLQECV